MTGEEETIVALATAPSRGAIAVVRISGPRAVEIARGLLGRAVPLEARRSTVVELSLVAEEGGRLRDEAVMTAFPGPSSYTGEDVVEISTHGSPVVWSSVLRTAEALGARAARPGEFTLRAFLNGRLDLARAEAVRDLVEATTERQVRAAFDQLRGTLSERIQGLERELFDLEVRLEACVDFPEEGYHFVASGDVERGVGAVLEKVRLLLEGSAAGRVVREGAMVALVGRPNVGKSTLFNRLAGADRAIVTDMPGTTRDVLAERVELGGLVVTLVDTAGIRSVWDEVEAEGVRRAERARASADLVVVVVDGASAPTSEDVSVLEAAGGEAVLVLNKADRGEDPGWQRLRDVVRDVVSVSALSGERVEEVRGLIARSVGGVGREDPVVTNRRHVERLVEAEASLERASRGLVVSEGQMPEELVLADLRNARQALEEISGKRTSEELLEGIFNQFCIGK